MPKIRVPALAAIALALLAAPTAGKNVTLSLPEGCEMSGGNGAYAITCTGTTPAPAPAPAPAPGVTPVTCTGVKTQTIDVTLGAAQTRYHSNGFAGGVVVFRITVPSTATVGSYYRFAGAQWAGEDVFRTMAISTMPCDFSNAMGSSALQPNAKSATFYAKIGQGDGYFPGLSAPGTYYLNVKNNTVCATFCDVYFDFVQN